jgi:hypothetical protein
MTRPNKLEGLSSETFSSQDLEFEGKARANPIGAPFRCFILGLPANVRLDWKEMARWSAMKEKKIYNIDTWPSPAVLNPRFVIPALAISEVSANGFWGQG